MAWSDEYCGEVPAPTITPPDIHESSITKEDVLNALGYEEITISKTDANGDTVTAYVAGKVVDS